MKTKNKMDLPKKQLWVDHWAKEQLVVVVEEAQLECLDVVVLKVDLMATDFQLIL